MAAERTSAIVQAGKPEAIERQLATLKSITLEIDQMRIQVEARKLAAKEEIGTIQALEKAHNEVLRVCKWLDD